MIGEYIIVYAYTDPAPLPLPDPAPLPPPFPPFPWEQIADFVLSFAIVGAACYAGYWAGWFVSKKIDEIFFLEKENKMEETIDPFENTQDIIEVEQVEFISDFGSFLEIWLWLQ